MTKRRSSLTGSWSGAYRFPADALPETVFNVQIEEVAGAFTGSMQEPNLLRLGPGQIVSADIEGTRSGEAVTFTKFYDGSGGMDHAIRYDGTVDDALTRIEGTWSIPRDWSGTFFMVRDDLDEEAEAEASAEARIDIRK